MPTDTDTRLGRLSRRVEALRQLTHLINRADDIESFSHGLAEFLCRTFDAGAASLVLVEPTTDELVFHTGSGVPSTILNQARLSRGEGIAGWVCQHHQSANVPVAREDPRFCPRVDQITGFYTRSVLCAPLYRQGQLEGAVQVINRNDGAPFDDDDAAFLDIIAEQVELLVVNVSLIAGLQRRNRELSALIEVDRAVNAVQDLDELLSAIVRSAVEVSQAAGCSVVLRNPETRRLTFYQAVGPAGGKLLDIEMDEGTGVVGYAIDQGESVYVPKAYEDPRFAARIDATTGFRTTSLLAVPLQTADGVIGALELVNLPHVDDPQGLIGLMEALASQAAIALERARMTRQLALRVDQADEQLRATNRNLALEQAKLTAMIGQMADAVIMIDADGRLMLVNQAARRLFGLGDAHLEGQPALEVRNVGLASALAVGEGDEDGAELTIEHPTRRVLRVHAASVRDETGERLGRVVVCTDITGLKELAELRSEVVSFVSHELRTPLTSIKGFAAALLADQRLVAQDLRNFVRVIDHECDRLRRLVSDLLCMSRLDAGRALDVRWQRVDLVELVHHVVEAQTVYAQTRVFETDLPAERLLIDGDQDKLEQILTNLVNNAVKYSESDTPVTVQVVEDGDEVVIRVIDRGYGIAPEDLAHLFQPYGRLADAERRHIRGTGLGLYLTKHLVEAHGGRIDVSSTPGEGSTFSVRLPRRRAWTGE